jgi:hypothetical protein
MLKGTYFTNSDGLSRFVVSELARQQAVKAGSTSSFHNELEGDERPRCAASNRPPEWNNCDTDRSFVQLLFGSAKFHYF